MEVNLVIRGKIGTAVMSGSSLQSSKSTQSGCEILRDDILERTPKKKKEEKKEGSNLHSNMGDIRFIILVMGSSITAASIPDMIMWMVSRDAKWMDVHD